MRLKTVEAAMKTEKMSVGFVLQLVESRVKEK